MRIEFPVFIIIAFRVGKHFLRKYENRASCSENTVSYLILSILKLAALSDKHEGYIVIFVIHRYLSTRRLVSIVTTWRSLLIHKREKQ